MPFYSSDYWRRTAWQIDDTTGHPIAECIELGGVLYTSACPLCGCLHELPRAARNGAVITPRCLLREFAQPGAHIPGSHTGWKLLYERWLAQRPDAPAHTAIVVRLVSIEELNERPPVRLASRPAASKRKDKAA